MTRTQPCLVRFMHKKSCSRYPIADDREIAGSTVNPILTMLRVWVLAGSIFSVLILDFAEVSFSSTSTEFM